MVTVTDGCAFRFSNGAAGGQPRVVTRPPAWLVNFDTRSCYDKEVANRGAGSAAVSRSAPVVGPSRQPKQARSRARVKRILDAADRIFAEEGYEAFTVRRITEVAGLPVGTVYQFFADKNAIVDALAYRYLGVFNEIMDARVADRRRASWSDVVDDAFDAFVSLYRANPGLLSLWQARHISSSAFDADIANNERLADGLRVILVSREQMKDNADLARACRVAVATVDALLDLAFRTNPHGDPKLIAEAKRMQKLYLADTIGRLRRPAGSARPKPDPKHRPA